MNNAGTWFLDDQWSVLELRGKDHRDFLHRLTTNVLPKQDQELVHSFLLSVNAKVLSEFWVGTAQEQLLLLVPREQLAQAQTTLEQYHFTEDLKLGTPELQVLVVIDEPPPQLLNLVYRHWSPDPRYGPGSHLLLCATERLSEASTILQEQGPRGSISDLEPLRVATGTPRFGLDYSPETLFLEMAQKGDFCETKGCYPGQEIVARVLHRGQLRRWLRGFRSEVEIPIGWSCQRDGKEVARVASSVPAPGGGSQGYLYVRREVGAVGTRLQGSVEGGEPLTLEVRTRPGEIEQHEDDTLCTTT